MIKETFKRIFHICNGNRVFVRKEPFRSESQFFEYSSTQTITKCNICSSMDTQIDWESMKSVEKPRSEW